MDQTPCFSLVWAGENQKSVRAVGDPELEGTQGGH